MIVYSTRMVSGRWWTAMTRHFIETCLIPQNTVCFGGCAFPNHNRVLILFLFFMRCWAERSLWILVSILSLRYIPSPDFTLYKLFSLYVYARTHAWACVQVRRQLVGVGSLFSPRGSQGSISGCQAVVRCRLSWALQAVLSSTGRPELWKTPLPSLFFLSPGCLGKPWPCDHLASAPEQLKQEQFIMTPNVVKVLLRGNTEIWQGFSVEPWMSWTGFVDQPGLGFTEICLPLLWSGGIKAVHHNTQLLLLLLLLVSLCF